MELPARHVAPLGRDGGARDHDLVAAAGHFEHGARVPRRLSRHRRRVLLPRGGAGGRRAHLGPASERWLELRGGLRRRPQLARLVRHGGPQCLAPRGVPALLRQRHLRRPGLHRRRDIPVAAVHRKAGSALQGGGRSRHRVRAAPHAEA